SNIASHPTSTLCPYTTLFRSRAGSCRTRRIANRSNGGEEEMKHGQIAAQLYTLREHTKTPEDFDRTLERVAAIGYPAVQVSGTGDRKSTRLNSSHVKISYAVF